MLSEAKGLLIVGCEAWYTHHFSPCISQNSLEKGVPQCSDLQKGAKHLAFLRPKKVRKEK